MPKSSKPKRSPRRSTGGDRSLERALEALASALDSAAVPWMVIGGIAIIARGVRRFTTDIHVAVRGDSIDVAELVRRLAAHRITPRIPDAPAFAATSLVLLMRHEPTGVDLDISLAWSAFEIEALAAATKARFGRVTLPMSRPIDLLVFKAIAGRPRDLEDMQSLLVLYPEMDIGRARELVAALGAAADAPELVEAVDRLLARAEPRV